MLGRALPPALFSLLFVISGVSAVPYNFKDNYHDPTPSPEDGPAASSKASRDRNILPYEICGVVGAYVFTVLLWGILLLTVGRKMRRKALEKPKQLDLELQDKPLWANELASPTLSTRSASSWLNKFRRSDSSVSSTPQTPIISSPTSFDQKVIDAQRNQAQADMERLYAAVMDQDAQKHLSQSSMEEREKSAIRNSAASRERRRPSAISIARSPEPIRAIPIVAVYPAENKPEPSSIAPPAAHTRLRAGDQVPLPSPRSILSKRSQISGTASTPGKSARFNLKNLRISGPIQKYPGESSHDEARTPLSPRFYNPGVPPSPPTQNNSPISPHGRERAEALDTVQPLPHPAPQRTHRPNLTISTPPPPPPPPQQHLQQQPPQQQQTREPPSSLPLRSFAQPLASPSIQTTVLSRRVEALTVGTPKTGVPFTPYSPYMPFTPITPVTPSHLVSRRDRKREGKRAGREVEREMVQTPKEIFGDAW